MKGVGVNETLASKKLWNYFAAMPAITLKAHFNGKHIVLDEPFDLAPDASLIVTVLQKADSSEDRQWQALALDGLARAFGENEPDYSTEDLKE